MAVEEVRLIPGYFPPAPPSGTFSLPPQQRCGTVCRLIEIKDVFFGLQLELRICWSRVRDHFRHS